MSSQYFEKRAETIRRMCQEQGLTVTPFGKGVWVFGNGVDILARDLQTINTQDLIPWRGPNFVQ